MFSFIYGPASSGKTEYVKRLAVTMNNCYVFIDASLYPNKKDINSIATTYAANGDNIVIDNAHLLSKENVETLRYLADTFDVDIKAVGLRTDADRRLFEGAEYLFALTDSLINIESYCECGEPAVFSIRANVNNEAVLYGEQLDMKAIYKPVCSKCYNEYIKKAKERENRDMIKELQDECGI